MLIDFLTNFVRCNSAADDDGIKHLAYPPISTNDQLRIIFLYGDPIQATLSLFRRSYHGPQSRKLLHGYMSPPYLSNRTSLKEYADRGVDHFKFESHFDRWLCSTHPHPILFIEFESLWDNLTRLLDFVGLPETYARQFPERRERNTSLGEVSPYVMGGLRSMYGDFRHRLRAFPDATVVSDGSSNFTSRRYKYLALSLRNSAAHSIQRAREIIRHRLPTL
jgi:hypothetical protein